MNRKINIVMNDAEDHSPAMIPHIIKTQITVTMKNRFQLSSNDCLVDFVLWNVLNNVFTNRKKKNPAPAADNKM